MADNVGNADARPDLDLDEAFGDERPTIDEQEMAEAEAGCGETGIGIPLSAGSNGVDPSLAVLGAKPAPAEAPLEVSPSSPDRAGLPAGHPQVPAGATMPAGHPAGVPRTGDGSESLPEATSGGHPSGHPAGIPMDRQRHGGARSVGFRPGGGPQALAYEERTGIKAPRIIAWEITRSCNLSCAHCRAAAEFGHYPGELSLDKIKEVIDDIVTISNPIVILTGGEPLMRPDIWEIVDYLHEKGAMPSSARTPRS